MAYCTYTDVQLFTGLTTSDIATADITSLIAYATAQLNSEINGKIINERVTRIDEVKTNKIDGANTTFYLKVADLFPIGDAVNDGDVDTSDLDVFTVDGSGTKTSVSISSITPSEAKFVLAAAPSTDKRLYCAYYYAPLDENTPHPLIKKACVELTAALCFTRIDAKKIKSIKLGDLTITKSAEPFKVFYDQYQQTLHDIKTRMAKRLRSKDAVDLNAKFGMVNAGDGTWWPSLTFEYAKERDFL